MVFIVEEHISGIQTKSLLFRKTEKILAGVIKISTIENVYSDNLKGSIQGTYNS